MVDNTPKLTALADRIHRDIHQREVGWVDATFDLCVAFAEARAQFTADIAFGRWCDANEFKLSHQDRAAAIAMGKEPTSAKQVLGTTTRRSLQHIYAQEFRFTHVSKPTEPKPRPVNHANDEKRQRAFAAYDRRKAAGEDMTMGAVQAEAGVSNTVIRAVFTTRSAQEQLNEATTTAAARAEFFRPLEEEVLAHMAKLTGAAKKRWDKQVEQYHWHIKQQITDGFNARLREWKEQTGAAYFEKRLDAVEELFTAWPHSVMRKAEYNAIMRCLHPDTAHSRSDEERAEAFRLFTHYKLKMVNDDKDRDAMRELRSNMPKTVEEMLARRHKAKEAEAG